MNESIVAISTPFGAASIAVVRVSGTLARQIALKLTRRKDLKTRYAHLCEIYADNDFIDEAIVLFFKAPKSFTGEDVAEFQIHGSTSVAQIILNECVRLGARLARAGEFSKRACLNGKMSALKALSINELIHAKSEKAAYLIAQNLSGKLGIMLDKIRTDLVRTLAFTETAIDYADDDLPSDLLESTRNLYAQNAQILQEIVELSRAKKGLIEGFKIAIIGKANVGKSSLLNALLNKNRAIVSDIEGTTRDRVEESLNLGTHLVKIIDTAGIRESENEIEKIGINLSLNALKEADIIIALFDNSREFDEEDVRILKLLTNSEKKVFWVLNKVDLPTQFQINLSENSSANSNKNLSENSSENSNKNLSENSRENLNKNLSENSSENSLSASLLENPQSKISWQRSEFFAEQKNESQIRQHEAKSTNLNKNLNKNLSENSSENLSENLSENSSEIPNKNPNLNPQNFIKISTKNSIEPLKNALINHLNSLDSDGFIITNINLLTSLENAALAIKRAENLLENSSLELFAFECNAAINELAKFTKNFDNEEILDEMFGNFCLGK